MRFRRSLCVVLGADLSSRFDWNTKTAPRFQLTKYYRYGEMDSCERFWDAFYAAMDRNNNTNTNTNGSKTTAKEEGTARTTIRATSDKVDPDGGINAPIIGTWNWKRRRREDERERNAFERAWEVVEPAVAKASWTRRYGDVFFETTETTTTTVAADSDDDRQSRRKVG